MDIKKGSLVQYRGKWYVRGNMPDLTFGDWMVAHPIATMCAVILVAGIAIACIETAFGDQHSCEHDLPGIVEVAR